MRLRDQALSDEHQERWQEAWNAYRQVLAIDAAVQFAQEGKARAEKIIGLEKRMNHYLAHPDLLVQRGTRDRDHGREIKSALQLIAEQSAALGDVLILAAQRPEHSIPPNVRFNCNVHLRMLGQGVKVGLEMSCMAADRGWVRTDEEIMTVAGTGSGADTALIIRASWDFSDTYISEIICKPI